MDRFLGFKIYPEELHLTGGDEGCEFHVVGDIDMAHGGIQPVLTTIVTNKAEAAAVALTHGEAVELRDFLDNWIEWYFATQ